MFLYSVNVIVNDFIIEMYCKLCSFIVFFFVFFFSLHPKDDNNWARKEEEGNRIPELSTGKETKN